MRDCIAGSVDDDESRLKYCEDVRLRLSLRR